MRWPQEHTGKVSPCVHTMRWPQEHTGKVTPCVHIKDACFS